MALMQKLSYILASTLIIGSAQANIVFDFSGNNANQTHAKAVLTLKDSYIFGSDITPLNFVSLTYRSQLQSFSVSSLELGSSVYAALNADGSLANSSGNYQFYLDTTTGKFLGVRTESTWTAYQNTHSEDGVHGKWTLRLAGMKSTCRVNDNFHKAAARDDTEYLRTCLKVGYPINQTERNGWTALHSAAQNNAIGAVQLLLSYGANPDSKTYRNETALDLANKAYNHDIASVLTQVTH